MAIAFSCGSCNSRIELPETAAGKRGKCQTCGEILTVPALSSKRCSVCGKDVSQIKRTKNAAGHYFCAECVATATKAEPGTSVAQNFEDQGVATKATAEVSRGETRSSPPPLPASNGATTQRPNEPPPYGGVELPDRACWHYTTTGSRIGPVGRREMVQLAQQKRIQPSTKVWTEGMHDWQPISETELVTIFSNSTPPPPLDGKSVSNVLVWLIAFAPIASSLISSALIKVIITHFATFPTTLIFWIAFTIGFALNTALCLADFRLVRNAGYSTRGMGVFAVLLVPVYLFLRAHRLRQMSFYAMVWIVAFVISIGIPFMILE